MAQMSEDEIEPDDDLTMDESACQHLESFKDDEKNIQVYTLLHAVFVVSNRSNLKFVNSNCRICKQRGPYLHVCLECLFIGCHKHIREHSHIEMHDISMDLIYGQLHCKRCNDYIYDKTMDRIAIENRMRLRTYKKHLFMIDIWNPTDNERELLQNESKQFCITPESTIGLRGLYNLGVSCFMNSVIQVLMHTPFLRDYFLNETHKCECLPGTCLVCELFKLFQEFYNGTKTPLALPELLHLIWIQLPHLNGNRQHDAHEFFISTLNLFHRHFMDSGVKNDINKLSIIENNGVCYCIIDKIFSGRLQSDLICQQCLTGSIKIDPIIDFSLELAPKTMTDQLPLSLIECLERFTQTESLDDSAKCLCMNCNSIQTFSKRLTVKTLPIVLTFHLKRFQTLNKLSRKISTIITFPETLDMTPFTTSVDDDTPFPIDNRYCLFAVISHIGDEVDAGHYIAYVRQLQDYWYECNDKIIKRVTLDEVLAAEGYILFYHKHVLEYE